MFRLAEYYPEKELTANSNESTTQKGTIGKFTDAKGNINVDDFKMAFGGNVDQKQIQDIVKLSQDLDKLKAFCYDSALGYSSIVTSFRDIGNALHKIGIEFMNTYAEAVKNNQQAKKE